MYIVCRLSGFVYFQCYAALKVNKRASSAHAALQGHIYSSTSETSVIDCLLLISI